MTTDAASPESAIKSPPAGILQADINGMICFVDARWREITGITKTALTPETIFQSLHPDDARAAMSDWNALKDSPQSFLKEIRFIKPCGKTVWVQSVIAPIKNSIHGTAGYIEALVDITDSKIAEETLKRTNNKLHVSIEKIKSASGLLPICASCKKIRKSSGAWQTIESYLCEHMGADLTHGICQDCARELLKNKVDH